MRAKWIPILGMMLSLLFSGPGKAGVYNPDLKDALTALTKALKEKEENIRKAARGSPTEKTLKAEAAAIANEIQQITEETTEPVANARGVMPLTFQPRFSLALAAQMEIPDTIRNTERRKRYVQRAEELRKKVEADPDNVTDRVSLSAYLIRLGQADQAVQVLEGLARGVGRNNFMVAANLATAYQLLGDLQRADDYLQQALRQGIWPNEWPGLSKEQLAWYKEAEEFQLKLIRLRRKELAAQGGKVEPFKTVDDLFGIKFIGEDGKYEAGTIAAEEKEKLPRNALVIVEQLILWLPGDPRLYWLLGELLNAQGEIDNAMKVLDQCSDGRKINATELRQHRRILAPAVATRAKELALAQREQDLDAREEDLKAREQALDNREKESKDQAVPSWMPEGKRLIMVGGAIGAIVVALAYLQGREMGRRKQAG